MTRHASAWLALIVALSLIPEHSFGASNYKNINDYYDKFLIQQKKPGSYIFFTSCELNHTVNIIWFRPGEPDGFYVEYQDGGLLLNGGGITLSRRGLAPMDLMGGHATQAFQMRIIKGLLRAPYRLVVVSKIRSLFMAHPRTTCRLD